VAIVGSRALFVIGLPHLSVAPVEPVLFASGLLSFCFYVYFFSFFFVL
jgi:hypothetical protein